MVSELKNVIERKGEKMGIKKFLKKSHLTKGIYQQLQRKKNQYRFEKKFKYTGKFIDRKKDSKDLCIILAGYKEFLYDDVLGRVKTFAPETMDICVLSSGIYSEKLNQICEENNWSYLSTEQNNISLIQNVAINLHPQAQYIYKIDEDIFITEHYFGNLKEAYILAQEGDYAPGVVAPLIPVNGYGHKRILQKLGLEDVYYEKFGEKSKYIAGQPRFIESNPEVAKFFWGDGEVIPTIDTLNAQFSKEEKKVNPCAIRFSIGAILFERSLWELMDHFNVEFEGAGLGVDEVQICNFCILNSKPLMVSENVVVGHLSFGPQNKAMFEYYKEHREKFSI